MTVVTFIVKKQIFNTDTLICTALWKTSLPFFIGTEDFVSPAVCHSFCNLYRVSVL